MHTYAEITVPNIPVAGQHVKQTMFGLQDYTVSGTIYCGSYYYGTTYHIVSTFQALSGAKLSTCTCSHPATTGRNSIMHLLSATCTSLVLLLIPGAFSDNESCEYESQGARINPYYLDWPYSEGI